MGRGLFTFLVLSFVLVLCGRFETVRAEGFAPVKSTHPRTVPVLPTARSHDANAPGLPPDEALDRLAERDDDETWSPGDRDLWTTDFLYRPVAPALILWTASCRLGTSTNVQSSPPLRC
jgi:hypothetical protein